MGGALLVCFFNSLVPQQKPPTPATLEDHWFPSEISICRLHYDPYRAKRMAEVNI